MFKKNDNSRNVWVVCIPRRDVPAMLYKFHDEALHPGTNRMLFMMYKLMTWKGMTDDVKEYIKSCHICQMNKVKPKLFSSMWRSIIPDHRGEILAVDIMGPLIKSKYGLTCILVTVDVFSKWVKLYGIRRAKSSACLNKIRRYVHE